MPVSGILMSRFGGHEINVFNLLIIPPLEKNMDLARFLIIHEVWPSCLQL